MNREYKKGELQTFKLPLSLDSFNKTGLDGVETYLIEYDGWHFEGATPKAVFNKVLKYIFVGGEE